VITEGTGLHVDGLHIGCVRKHC